MLPSSRFTEERCKFTEDRRNIKNPYSICHMMTSLDGRIDCVMPSKLPGVVDYYITLDAIRVPTTVSGMPAVFDGLAMEHDVTALKLLDVQKFDSGAVWLRYSCK